MPIGARRGGYRLVDGYRTRLTGLNADEAEALFLSGLEGPAAQLGLGTVLAAAQLKVMAALPAELRGRASRLRERFLLVAPGWFRSDEDPACLSTVSEAAWEGRPLEIVYRRSEGPVKRHVEPLGVVLKAGIWYLVAQRDRTFRTYRVSRIISAAIGDGTFERPPDFDLARYWEASTSAFEANLRRLPVTVRVRADALGDLAYATSAERQFEAWRRLTPDSEGWVTITVRTESLDAAHDDLLRLGDRAEVLAPEELRDRVAVTVAAMGARYGRRHVEADG